MSALSASTIWLVLAVLLTLVEVMTLTFFLMWIALAAFILAIVTWVAPDMSMATQLILFALLSIVITLPGYKYIRPMVKKSEGETLNARTRALIGQGGPVVIDGAGNLKIQIGDTFWLAKSDENFQEGETGFVTGSDSTMLLIKHFKD